MSGSPPTAKAETTYATLPNGRPLVDNTGQAIRRKRPQSCDLCRQRKTKCLRPEGEALDQGDTRCVQCRTAGVECRWDYIPKRPGPQRPLSGSIEKAAAPTKRQKQDHASSSQTAGESSTKTGTSARSAPNNGKAARTQAQAQSSQLPPSPRRSGSGLLEAAQTSAHFDNPPPNPYHLSNYGFAQRSYADQQPLPPQQQIQFPMAPPGDGSAASRTMPTQLHQGQDGPIQLPPMGPPATGMGPHVRYDLPNRQPGFFSNPQSPASSTFASGHERATSQQQQPAYLPHPNHGNYLSSFSNGFDANSRPVYANARSPVSDTSSSKPRARQLGKTFAAPIERPRSLDDVAPRATFLSIISLYFHHLYPLMPIVHQPSFSHDLISRRDERDADFLSFTLSLTAYTLIQCPRSVVPAPWRFYRKLHQICHLTSRKMQLERHTTADAPTLTQCGTLYTTHIYMGSTGRTFAANAIHGELVRTAFSINLHDETRAPPPVPGSSYSTTQPQQMTEIERQLRRRVYWLMRGSDATISLLSDEPVSLRDSDAIGVEIPAAIDDDFIFLNALGEQPRERGPSILCGFETVSKLHKVMSILMENFRLDRTRPPATSQEVRGKLRNASAILAQVHEIVDAMPDVLRTPSFKHTEPPPRSWPAGELPDLGMPFYHPGSKNMPMYTLPFAPWPSGTFDENGLPIPTADGASQPSSSAAPSPSAWGALQGPLAGAGASPASFFGFGNDLLAGGPSLPPPRPGGNSGPGSPSIPSTAQLNAARDQVVAFRPSPPPPAAGSTEDRVPILSGFAICRANILVTEAMLRFVLVEYRELLQGHLKRLLKAEQIQRDGNANTGVKDELNVEGIDDDDDGSSDIEEAARSFFSDAVATLPFDALAANGQSLILKLVFIVSTLLNRTRTSSKAYTYMSEFLSTLGKLSERRTAGDEEPDSEEEEDKGGIVPSQQTPGEMGSGNTPLGGATSTATPMTMGGRSTGGSGQGVGLLGLPIHQQQQQQHGAGENGMLTGF